MITEEVCTVVTTEDLKPGSVVSGLHNNGNRYGVESVKRAKFSSWGSPHKDSFVVVLGVPGTDGGCIAIRCNRGTNWYVWEKRPKIDQEPPVG